MLRKQAKMTSMGPMMRQPTQQKEKTQLKLSSGQMEKQIQSPKKSPMSMNREGFPKRKLKESLLKSIYDFELIFFFLCSLYISRQRETIPPRAKQKITEFQLLQLQKMRAVSRMRATFGKLRIYFEKKRKKLRSIMPAPAAVHPIIIILMGKENSSSLRLRTNLLKMPRRVSNVQGRRLQTRSPLIPVDSDLNLRVMIVAMTCTVVGPGKLQQRFLIQSNCVQLSQRCYSTMKLCVFWRCAV